MDWTEPPDPFRQFAGGSRMLLPLGAMSIGTRFGQISRPGEVEPGPLAVESIGSFLQLSMGLTAWKEYGPDRWSLRSNPSSGNLYPTETYVLCHRIDGVANGLHH